MYKILIIDDEVAICDSLCFTLEDNYDVRGFTDFREGLSYIASNIIDVVLLDLNLGEESGIEVLKQIKLIDTNIQVIIMTAYGSIKTSVQAIKEGASHYITKPLDYEELMIFIEKAIEYKKMIDSLKNLKEVMGDKYSIEGIIGSSKPMLKLFAMVDKIKDIDSTVLIIGESGTGKDLIAKALHSESKRSSSDFQIVNCAAIPANLLESELFGHEKGAFTGAEKKRIGKMQLAHKGTLFLDEIGEMDLLLQAKILRVVEDGIITPVGSERSIEVDVRIIAATNRDLELMVEEGKFREDLFYRLNVISLNLPALREREGDLASLLSVFLKKYSDEFGKSIKSIDPKVITYLEEYNFPGNVRELENLIKRMVVFAEGDKITLEDLPDKYKVNNKLHEENMISLPIGSTMKDIEREAILKTLEYYNHNKKITAQKLKISERNLHYKIKEYLS